MLAEKAQAKIDELSSTLKWLRGQGIGVQVVLNADTSEQLEKVEIGKSDWRRILLIPRDWAMDVKNAYIADAALGSARAFATVMAELLVAPEKTKKGASE